MYKVMLVDDDYPVLELMTETIPWRDLGLALAGAYENGADALEAAERDMPDILVTDIGMPRMDGLELIGRMKARNPSLRAAILSCHTEFDYAKRAMNLQVQDYIVKDTLDPDDFAPLLKRLAGSIDEERRLRAEQSRLRLMADRSLDALRERWARSAVQQPMLGAASWQAELESFGLPVDGRAILPAAGFLDDLHQARSRFVSDEALRFAVTNLADEVLRDAPIDAVLLPYNAKAWFVLCAFRPTLKVNGYAEARLLLERVQQALRDTLKLSMTFIVGEQCDAGGALKAGMKALLGEEGQRFYMARGETASRRPLAASGGDLFARYDEAAESFREAVMRGDAARVAALAAEWASRIRERMYSPETVKDWALKLLLDIRLKHQSLHAFRSKRSAESLHKDVAEIGSLLELQDWLTRQMLDAIRAAEASAVRTQRKEVLDACAYVATRLDQRIGLEEMADHLHLNASYFSRLFKKETGETFIEYVTRAKMERAKELLDRTALPVVRICEMLGYDNQSYFIKLFKMHAGFTPIDYRHRTGNG